LRIKHVQKVGGFSFEPKPPTVLAERLSYPKATTRRFDGLDCCFRFDITFDIVSFVLRKYNQLGNRFLGYGLNAERFNSKARFICGCGKIGIDCNPYAPYRVNLCRSRNWI
jgi:hypothetical protein